jgi:polysaccharide export outer membrane protein
MRTLFYTGLLLLVTVGQQVAAQEPSVDSEYRIGPEDVLLISVWQNAELTRTVPVRPDGKISLPLLNDVQAAGLTPMQLRDQLKAKLAEYVPAAELSVIVAEIRSVKVSVIGKVMSPRRLQLKGPTTVLDALAEAGGFQEFADTEKIVVLRPNAVAGRPATAFKRIPFSYKKAISAGGEADNFTLQSGDIIVVP